MYFYAAIYCKWHRMDMLMLNNWLKHASLTNGSRLCPFNNWEADITILICTHFAKRDTM